MKNSKGLVIITIILGVLVVIMGGYIVYDSFIKNNAVIENDGSTSKNDNNNTNNSNVSISTTDGYVNITVNYAGDFIDLNKYISDFDGNDEYNNKLLNLTVSSIKINGKNHTFQFNNHPKSCSELIGNDSYNDYHNAFYIDDVKIYNQNNQGCYLERANLLTVIDNEYIGIAYNSQGGNYMKVYNENAKLVDTIEFLNIKIENNEIIYSEYEEGNGCLVNNYSYTFSNGKSSKTFKSQENNTTCNEMTGEGCCNY